jgi:hypothetical protein
MWKTRPSVCDLRSAVKPFAKFSMKFGIRILDKKLSDKLQFLEYWLLDSHTIHSNLCWISTRFFPVSWLIQMGVCLTCLDLRHSDGEPSWDLRKSAQHRPYFAWMPNWNYIYTSTVKWNYMLRVKNAVRHAVRRLLCSGACLVLTTLFTDRPHWPGGVWVCVCTVVTARC